MSAWPQLKEVRTFLRLQVDAVEDPVIQTALSAAIDYGMRRLGTTTTVVDNGDGTTTTTVDWTYPADTADLPDAGHQACVIHAARLYRRRDSIDGTISWGDLGGVRVPRIDPDIESLYTSLGPVVFG